MSGRDRITAKVAAAKEKSKADSKSKSGDARDIGDFEYEKKNAKVLKKALHNINVSLGTLLAAMKDLAMLRGSAVTPDGKLGGKGFIMNFRDMKSTLNTAVSDLSDITDTIADELTNPRWGLSNTEVKGIKKDQEKTEEEVEEVEEIVEEPKKEKPEDKSEGESGDDISPDDVKNSAEVESINRYKSLLEGPSSMDKTARDLSKNILANLMRGE